MPKALRRSTVLIASVLLLDIASASNAPAEEPIVGCWSLRKGDVLTQLCFKDNGDVKTDIYSYKGHEGFGARGLYETNDTRLKMLGFADTEGWPSDKNLEDCAFSFPGKNTLRLADCGLSGDWRQQSAQNSN